MAEEITVHVRMLHDGHLITNRATSGLPARRVLEHLYEKYPFMQSVRLHAGNTARLVSADQRTELWITSNYDVAPKPGYSPGISITLRGKPCPCQANRTSYNGTQT
jgi:hypothetical protein